MKEKLEKYTDSQILDILVQHYELFRMEYADEESLEASYNFRHTALTFLLERLENDYAKRKDEIRG